MGRKRKQPEVIEQDDEIIAPDEELSAPFEKPEGSTRDGPRFSVSVASEKVDSLFLRVFETEKLEQAKVRAVEEVEKTKRECIIFDRLDQRICFRQKPDGTTESKETSIASEITHEETVDSEPKPRRGKKPKPQPSPEESKPRRGKKPKAASPEESKPRPKLKWENYE